MDSWAKAEDRPRISLNGWKKTSLLTAVTLSVLLGLWSCTGGELKRGQFVEPGRSKVDDGRPGFTEEAEGPGSEIDITATQSDDQGQAVVKQTSTPPAEVESPRDNFEQMVLIPAGLFWMGCDETNATLCYEWELPLHQVWLDAYWVDIYEVTNRQYRECVAAGVCREPWLAGAGRLYDPSYDLHPVNGVDWEQAQTYCRFAGKRLLTEAEWEKAARGAGRTSQYPWEENAITCQRANYYQGRHLEPGGYCISPPEGDTTPVGFYNGENWLTNDQGRFQTIDSPSPYGLYDVIGNVAEWVAGNIPSYPWPGDVGSGLFGEKELARGCSYSNYEHLCDVHCRGLLFEKVPGPEDDAYLDDLHFFGIRCGLDVRSGSSPD